MGCSFKYKNAIVNYRKTGVGKTVVLLHGFGEDSSIFDSQFNYLKDKCCLIIPDLPGTGKSSILKIENREPIDINHPILKPEYQLTIDDFADCINALLETEKIEQCIMLGHSMGGYITLSFAEKFANKLNAFGLIHSTAFADSEEKKENRKRGIELVENYGAFSFLKNTINNLFGKKFKEKRPEEIEALISKAKQFENTPVQQYTFAMMNRLDKTLVLKQSQVPVLFIIGTEDVAAPMNDVIKQSSLPDCAYVYVLQDIGHMSMLEAPDLLNKHLQDFIVN